MIEEEEKARLQEWMIGLWAQSRAGYHAGIVDKDMPQTKADQKKKVFDWKIQEAKKARKKHDEEWMRALSSPKHFGAFMGMESILGEPDSVEERSLAEKAKEGYEAGRRALKNLFKRAS